MPKLSQSLIQSHYRSWKKKESISSTFGYTMNEMYKLNDIDLANEKDDNMALLRLLKDHVYKDEAG